ncbi:MAG: hypothetical protein EFKGCFLK_00858 [Rhodocyclaceae bacterium]|nr:hypothetical protein [Zoogloeaceae bacterium]MBV6407298.1 hypothetical protein [Rhodocyclaceae bacterium]MCK6383863.1 hypothetical protein [Rhodocyclaceae bacterium]CAG0943989.1 hypothetical protein GPROT2_02372 [Gammaproteobacteria bacterium]
MSHERRKNHKLRAIFEEVYGRVEGCFEVRPPRGLPLEWMVFRAARAAYPQLTTLDLFQFAMASLRVYRSRNPGLPPFLAC